MFYCNHFIHVYDCITATSTNHNVLSIIIQTRQLNLWGFTRLTRCGLWSHEDFIRGNTERLDRIQRVEIKSTVVAATDGKSKPKKKATQQRKSARPTRTSSRRVLAASPDNSLHTVDESLPTPQEAVVSPSPQNEAANVMGIPAAMPMPLLSQMVWPAASSSNYATANASSQQVSYPVVSFTNSVDDSQSYQGYPSSPIQYQQQTTNNLGHSMVNSGYQPRMPLQRRGITSPLSNHTVKQQQYTDQQQQLPPSNVTTTSDNNDNSTTNEDLMFLLSGIFEAEVNGPSSTDDNDLCSILSLIDMSDDFMEPISFY